MFIINYLAYPMMRVNYEKLLKERKRLQEKYKKFYETEVHSDYYYETGIIFSTNKLSEDEALKYYEKQQLQAYGTFDHEWYLEKLKEMKARYEKLRKGENESEQEKNIFINEIKSLLKTEMNQDEEIHFKESNELLKSMLLEID